MVCKDYAYNTVPEADIHAGEGIPTGIAKNIVATDVSDLGNGKDLRLTFNKADDEFTVLRYRLFVVKAEDSATFNTQKAISVSLENYTNVFPDEEDQELLLKTTSKDIDGDLITENQEYLVYIVSYPAGLRSDDYKISASNSFILKNSTGIAESRTSRSYYFYKDNELYIKGSEKGVDFLVFDLSGKVLKNYKNISSSVRITGLKPGIFILSVNDNGIVNYSKLIISE